MMGGSVCHQEGVQGDVRDGMGRTEFNVMSFWNNNTHMSQKSAVSWGHEHSKLLRCKTQEL